MSHRFRWSEEGFSENLRYRFLHVLSTDDCHRPFEAEEIKVGGELELGQASCLDPVEHLHPDHKVLGDVVAQRHAVLDGLGWDSKLNVNVVFAVGPHQHAAPRKIGLGPIDPHLSVKIRVRLVQGRGFLLRRFLIILGGLLTCRFRCAGGRPKEVVFFVEFCLQLTLRGVRERSGVDRVS